VDERTQLPQDGAGAFFHRRYGVHIEDTPLSAEQLMERITGNLNAASPVEVAVFDKTHGSEGDVCVGDEYVVRMPGPWDGPVRVIDRTPTSFRLATLHGHLEAGQIEFRARADPVEDPTPKVVPMPDGLVMEPEATGGAAALRFEIESWARSGDRLSDLLYDRVRLAKEMQLHMWCHFCERVAVLAGGRIRGGIDVRTRRVDAAEVPALLSCAAVVEPAEVLAPASRVSAGGRLE
jgi:hypothetical protein